MSINTPMAGDKNYYACRVAFENAESIRKKIK